MDAAVAWVEDVSAAEATTAIYLRAIASPATESHSVTASNDGRGHREDGIAWAPDGHTMAFLSDNGHPGQQQLYVIDVDAAAPARRVTSVKGQLAQPRWSPDGTQLAVLFVAGSTQGTGALVAYKPDAGVVGEVEEEQRIAIVALATGAVREVSPANMFVYDYDWSRREGVRGSGRRIGHHPGSRSLRQPTAARRPRSGSRRRRRWTALVA
jgi:dipeptidyl aminopeptidase/acylaminoacyl peptidase